MKPACATWNVKIAGICRKVARHVVKTQSDKMVRVTEQSVAKYLGPPKFKKTEIEEEDQVGMATGMAWTQVGGELLFVETLTMPRPRKRDGYRKAGRRDERVGPGRHQLRALAGRPAQHR